MNPFDTIRTERPPVDSITSRRRSEVRELLLGRDVDDAAPHLASLSSASDGIGHTSAENGQQRPRRFLLVAAAAIVAVGVAGLVVALRQPPAAPVIDQPSVPVLDSIPTSGAPPIDDGDAISPPATLPLPIEQTGESTTPLDDTAPAEGIVADEPPAFTPLVLATPPDGFTLFSATYMPGVGGFGIARYRNPDTTTTELQIIVRDEPDWTQFLVDAGRMTFDVDGRTVFAGGEGNGDCLPDVCQIDVQFDDHAGVSIMWATVDGTPLRDGSTRETLFPLVSTLVSDPTVWTANTGETPFPLPTSEQAPLLVPFGPGEASYTGTVYGGPPGSSALTLRAPDGTAKPVYLTPGSATAPTEGPSSRRFGDIVVSLLSDPAVAEVPVYGAQHRCWNMQIIDGGTWPGGAWRDEMVEFFESFAADDTGAIIELPAGWEVIAASDRAMQYEVQFSIPRPGGEPAQISILQSPGQHAYYGTTGSPWKLTPFDAFGPGWSIDAPQPEATQIFFEANGWSYVASSGDLASGELMDLLTSMTAIDIDEWIRELGPLDVPDNDLALEGDCTVPTMTAS